MALTDDSTVTNEAELPVINVEVEPCRQDPGAGDSPADAGRESGVPEAAPAPKVSVWERIFVEIREVGLVIAYLAVSFSILETFRCATLLSRCSENDFMAGYATAGVGALLLGKFVFVLEKMRVSRRFEHRPLIFAVVYKTVLFTVLVNLILHAEGRIMHHDLMPGPPTGDPTRYWLCFFAHQLAFVVTFFIFFSFREIGRVVGPGRMLRLFFVSRDS